MNIPSKVFLAEELKQGRFPLWNPYIFSGTPFFADINLSLLHPLNLLYLVLPPFRALTVGILVLFLVSISGMYVLGRTLRLGRFGSLVGAVVFGFSGSLVVYANNIPILQVAVLLPWVLAVWIRYLERPTGKRLVAFVLMAAFQFISGHPQFTYYTWLILAAYTAVVSSLSWGKRLGYLVKAAIFVSLVSSIQAIPFIQFVLASTRMGRDFAFATIDSAHPLSLVRLIIPGIVGDLSRGTAWIQAGTIHGYTGFLTLLLLPLAWHSKIGRFFIAAAIASILMAMGRYTPVYWMAYHVVPGIAWFREPAQFLFLWSFSLAGTTMVAADYLAEKARQNRYIFIISFMFLLMASTPWEHLTLPYFFPGRLLEKIASLPWQQRKIISESLLYNFSLFGTLGIFAALAIRRLRSSFIAKTLFLSVLFVDLYVYGQTNVTTVSETIVRGWQEEQKAHIASWKLETGNYRYYTDPAIYPYPNKKTFGQFNDPGESAWQFKILRPTLGMMYGLSAVDGYASMVLRSYQKRFGQATYDPTGVVISSIVDPSLPKAGVRYIITKRTNLLLSDTTRYQVLAVEGEIAVYEDKNAILVTSARESEK
ncbi:hypothetical protein HY032_01295 [Candidatus Gottesmanbacteria bacterium]|nr:hypothetical protein [Candidatus Gottesmanbacteria bacterium]